MFENIGNIDINLDEMDEDTRRGYEVGVRMGRALLSKGLLDSGQITEAKWLELQIMSDEDFIKYLNNRSRVEVSPTRQEWRTDNE